MNELQGHGQEHGNEAAATGSGSAPAPGRKPLTAGYTARPDALPSFDALIAEGGSMPLSADLRSAFEAAHGVGLAGVVVHESPILIAHELRGLARGLDIAVASAADREAIEHELGHIVDVSLAGGPSANAKLGELDLSDDPAREARADALAEKARAPAPRRAPGPLRPAANAPGAAQPKLTNRGAIGRNGDGTFDWQTHKTQHNPKMGGGHEAEGLGAVLSTTVVPKYTGTQKFEQLETMDQTVTPARVDDARNPLPSPPEHMTRVGGRYVLPAPMLGLPCAPNRLYLPQASLVELARIQTEMVDLSKRAPARLRVNTGFGADGLADRVDLRFETLHRISGAPEYTLDWTVAPPTDRSTWGLAPTSVAAGAGAKPVSAEWKTKVEWTATNAAGDGVRMVADKLGPDHALGTSPTDSVAKGRVAQLEAASTPPPLPPVKSGKQPPAPKAEPYIAGHLLNDHLGGPGDLAANLAPIPKTANGQMASSMEKPTKAIVNNQRGWVRYVVDVSHSNDPVALTTYPSRIDAELSVYDQQGVLTPVNRSHITISAPSSYAGTNIAKPVAPKANRTLTGDAIESSPKAMDEVVLSKSDDLRPFLNESGDLFQLIFGSELSSSIENPKTAEAWSGILALLGDYERAALPALNSLATIISALKVWENDGKAREYLGTTRAGDLQDGLDTILRHADKFADLATPLLQDATTAVKKQFRPTDLFADKGALRLASELVRQAPRTATLFQLVSSQQASSIPMRHRDLKQAKTTGDLPTEQREEGFRVKFRSQPPVVEPTFLASPVRLFQDYGRSVSQLNTTAHLGAQFESDRGKKTVEVFRGLVEQWDGILTIGKLRDLPALKKSERLQALLVQLDHANRQTQGSLGGVDAMLLESFIALWKDAIERLAREEPDVAVALFDALGIV